MKAILAINEFNVIGNGDELIWHIPEDLKFFKRITTGKTVVMGRKTFESLKMPNGLPNRQNKVLTRGMQNLSPNVFPISSWSEIEDDAFIIGGATLYNYGFANKLFDEIFVTQVKSSNSIQTGTSLEFDLFGVIPKVQTGTCIFQDEIWYYHGNDEGFVISENSEFQFRIGILRRIANGNN
jgi:dihydrofolate reductase